MIVGIGTDIVAVVRMSEFWNRHQKTGAAKILGPDELAECAQSSRPDRFLAKRFAAKEALGKAMGTGIRSPLLMPEMQVIHDELGKPAFHCSGAAGELLASKALRVHLSISDEQEFAVAFVVVEQT